MPPRRKSSLMVLPDGVIPVGGHGALSVKDAADSGVRRDLLVALRARIAADVDSAATPPRDLAALSRRLMDIAKEIESLDAQGRMDDIGEAASTPDEEWAAS